MLREGQISLENFLLGFGIVSYFILDCSGINNQVIDWLHNNICVYCITFYSVINFLLVIFYRGYEWQIAVRSCFLGTICGCGIIASYIYPASYRAFGFYIIALSIFHFSEYFVTAVTNPKTLTLDSFLLNHSIAYWVAAIASWVEFFLERWFLPNLKQCWYITLIGIVLCFSGDVIRKLAMITANTNFNHVVQTEKTENHQLVTWGIYRFFRHPSYVGWFWWSVGTQIILVNPFCLVGYAVASWTFFNDRVEFEEMTLVMFFGPQYIAYKQRVSSGLPFIRGYRMEPIVHND